MVYRKWRQKKINSENGNFPSVDNQNSQEDKIVVNTEENKQSEGTVKQFLLTNWSCDVPK